MKLPEFVNTVRERTGLDSDAAAMNAIQATFKALAERITQDEADDLAAQLPQEIAAYLHDADVHKSFELDDFYYNVSRRESIGLPQAREHARAVMSVVEETVSPGELRDIFAQLPDEFLTLFTFGSDYRNLEGD